MMLLREIMWLDRYFVGVAPFESQATERVEPDVEGEMGRRSDQRRQRPHDIVSLDEDE